jgi:hypothetical protein
VKKKDEAPIICGTDFSDAAIEAVDIAAAIARRLETKLVLVHVDESYGIAAVDSKLFEAAVAHRRPELDRMADRLRELGTDVDEKLVCGSAFGNSYNRNPRAAHRCWRRRTQFGSAIVRGERS